MMVMLRCVLPRAGLAVAALCSWVMLARATPLDFVPVGDPIESELRILDLIRSDRIRPHDIRLRHLHTRPLQVLELRERGYVRGGDSLGGDPLADDDPATIQPDRLRDPSAERIQRWLSRDWPQPMPVATGDAPASWVFKGTTPRLFERPQPHGPGQISQLELSAAIEGTGVADAHDTYAVSGSGVHARAAVRIERWLAYSHIVFGEFDDAQTFADPIVANTDITTLTEETYLAYTAGSGHWAAMFGRNRWHWGPGEEGSLLLSKTSPAFTGLSLRATLPDYHLDFAILNGTLAASAGEQLAAHRIEWQPLDNLRLGASEAARYQSSGWSPLYAVGVIPYVIVQRLQAQDEPDSGSALRNNVMFSVDAAWRLMDGMRIYGELLIDDLAAKTNDNPNKLGYQLGFEGVHAVGGSRATWGIEYTQLSRYVYTSFFGRAFSVRDQPLGFPSGPDARRFRVRGGLDVGPDWQLQARIAQSDQGDLGLDDPFVPGDTEGPPFELSGVVERTRDADLGLRWWPASGVDITARGGYRWIENQGNVSDADDNGPRASLTLRLIR